MSLRSAGSAAEGHTIPPAAGARSRRWVGLGSAALICAALSVVPGGVALGHAAAEPTPPADSQSAPDAETAMLIAQTYAHPVVVDSLTTETAQTSALPSGSMQLDESTMPERVQRNGAWTGVDTTLAPSGGVLAPAATTVPNAVLGGWLRPTGPGAGRL